MLHMIVFLTRVKSRWSLEYHLPSKVYPSTHSTHSISFHCLMLQVYDQYGAEASEQMSHDADNGRAGGRGFGGGMHGFRRGGGFAHGEVGLTSVQSVVWESEPYLSILRPHPALHASLTVTCCFLFVVCFLRFHRRIFSTCFFKAGCPEVSENWHYWGRNGESLFAPPVRISAISPTFERLLLLNTLFYRLQCRRPTISQRPATETGAAKRREWDASQLDAAAPAATTCADDYSDVSNLIRFYTRKVR